MPDFDLERFVEAQHAVYERALSELRSGRKTSHWMWYVFPQLRGLGRSKMAQLYGIVSVDEAEAYLAHPVLGPRLVECTEAVLNVHSTPHMIFGNPDDVKFISCMSLFAIAGREQDVFHRALETCNRGFPDDRTVDLIMSNDG